MKFAICNEVFQTPIEESIRTVAEIGYDGVEVAPFTIAESVEDIAAERRRAIRQTAADCGIEIVGLHWVLASPKGLHITTPDDTLRRRSWEYTKAIVNFCGDLGGEVIVLGSPSARDIVADDTIDDAMKRAADGLRNLAPVCAERNVNLLLEPLHPEHTNFMASVEEALKLRQMVDHPRIGYILDTRAMSGFKDGILGTIEKYGADAGHYHVNDPSGLGPGMGDFDFAPVFQKLDEVGFSHWASAEPFDYKPDSVTVAKTGLETMRAASA